MKVPSGFKEALYIHFYIPRLKQCLENKYVPKNISERIKCILKTENKKTLFEALVVERALDQEEFSEICQFHDL